MSNLNPSIQHHNLLQEICKPLKKLGVIFFGYTAVDASNNAYCLGSKIDYASAYLSLEGAKSDIHCFDQSAKDRFEYSFWDYAELKTTAKALYEMAANFDQSHTLSITHHTKEITHCYHFSGDIHDDGINQRYLNHLDSLHAYIDYFDECLKTIPEIASVYNNPIYIGPQPRALEVQLLTSNPKDIDLLTQGAHTLRFKHFYQYYLTKKERNCLYWLKQGKTTEMIAEINNVSRKTIERHISSIKKKFDCYTLFQLGVKIGATNLSEYLLVG